MKTILAISGSLRANSANTTLLENIGYPVSGGGALMPFMRALATCRISTLILIRKALCCLVKALRDHIKNAAAVVICTPEYAFGVPGVLKKCAGLVSFIRRAE